MLQLLIERLLEQCSLMGRMLREVVLRFLNTIIFSFKRALNLVSALSAKIPGMLQALTSVAKKPTSKDDYIETKRMFVSKSLLIIIAFGIAAFLVIWFTMLWPAIVSRFLTNHLWVQNEKTATYDGKAVVYYDKAKKTVDYEGRLVKGALEGEGRQYDEEGKLIYEGSFEAGERTGKGKIYEGGTLVYDGGLKEGVYEGSGTLYEQGAIVYSGDFTSGQYNGKGILYYKNGGICYSGNFVEGEYSGRGELHEDSLDNYVIYSGDFKENEYEGSGKLYENGELVYSGGFAEGHREGKGKAYEGKQLIYDGEFANDMYNGTGVEYYPNGNERYSGGFKDDLYSGDGVYTTAKDILISGSFENGDVKKDAVCSYEGKKFYEGEFARLVPSGKGTSYTTLGIKVYEGEFNLWNINGGTLIDTSVMEIRNRFLAETIEELGEDGFVISCGTAGIYIYCTYANDEDEAKVSRVFETPTAGDKTLSMLKWKTPAEYEEDARLSGHRYDCARGRAAISKPSVVPIALGSVDAGSVAFRAYPQENGNAMIIWCTGDGNADDKILVCEWKTIDESADFIASYAFTDEDEAAEGEEDAGGDAAAAGGGSGVSGGNEGEASQSGGTPVIVKNGSGSAAAQNGSGAGENGETDGEPTPEEKQAQLVSRLSEDVEMADTSESKLNQVLIAAKADKKEYEILAALIDYAGNSALKSAAEANIEIYHGLEDDEKQAISVGLGDKDKLKTWSEGLKTAQEEMSGAELKLIDAEKKIIQVSGRNPDELDITDVLLSIDPSVLDKDELTQEQIKYELSKLKDESAGAEDAGAEEAGASEEEGSGEESASQTMPEGPGTYTENKPGPGNPPTEESEETEEQPAEEVEDKLDREAISKNVELQLRLLSVLHSNIEQARTACASAEDKVKKTEEGRSVGKYTIDEVKITETEFNTARAKLISQCAEFTAGLAELDQQTGGWISRNYGWFDQALSD